MKASIASLRALAFALPLTVLALAACGGNRPSDQPATPTAATPAPSEPAAAPAPSGDQVAQLPPSAEPATPAEEVKPASKPAPKPPKPKPAPAPPKPEPVVKTIAAGTSLDVELIDPASSNISQVGDAVRARVTKAIVIDGMTAVPVGAVVVGVVTEAVSLRKIGGTASLGLRFDSLDTGTGPKVAIAATLQEKGKSENGKDAGTIAGATAGGALLGRLLSKHDKTKGTIIGAVVGAAAGTGAAAATKGKEVELPAGTPLALQLEQALNVTIQP